MTGPGCITVTSRRKAVLTRRSKTIPTVLAATTVGLFGLPILAPAAVLVDIVRLKLKMPTLRIYLFLLQYLFNDSVEVLLAPFLWVTRASLTTHHRLQWWSVNLLVKRAGQLLGITVIIDETALSAVAPGPVIVVSRHVSIFDSSLPALLCNNAGLRTRGLIMAELLADPGFDIIYSRLGWAFIPREDGPAALSEVRKLASGSDEETALMIFPEGRLFRPEVLERSLAKLAKSAPERAARLSSLQHSLPPRPGGFLALLAAAPDADVVVVSHRGLDKFGGIADLAAAVPADSKVTVSARRIARVEIPQAAEDQVAWLDQLWLDQEAGLGGHS